MALYKVTLRDGQTFFMEADMAEPTSQVYISFPVDPQDLQPTPYATADGTETVIAGLLAEHYMAGPAEGIQVAGVVLEPKT